MPAIGDDKVKTGRRDLAACRHDVKSSGAGEWRKRLFGLGVSIRVGKGAVAMTRTPALLADGHGF